MSDAPWTWRFFTWADRLDDQYNGDDHRPWHPAFWLWVFADWLRTWFPHQHFVIDDQCRMPEHRFCVWCGRAMPNKPLDEDKGKV